jgi:hypothetical protein
MMRRALDRLEARSPARVASQDLALLPGLLRLALRDRPDDLERIAASPEWAALVAPFPLHMGSNALQRERERRLGPVMASLGQLHGGEVPPVALFVAALQLGLTD